ncbi:ammonia-dependent NAD(+) synthetase [Pseudomonas sp. LPB0260]|uniref:ammonia-dependent NAD(+) synthetase n=1 Tax=Pseudomonas sp. LPB0260 TaxID=2614442 RepID=UPI0015C248F8|nr:ammonia-dependent NAD(+) synthetase [Pseudomonas sp. LPB0260]QLC72574.1 ammonia-dependent NAD(+) synthetase [Pseudomonas sp. LPB0260]QLC75348.1 ammonia-dependent NAD(+) synthetase [Pseudomonas sp. LPB0260]
MNLQQSIGNALGVRALDTPAELASEVQRRLAFIKERLGQSGCSTLVLGISGGVDSLTAGLLCQKAAAELRAEGRQAEFIAVRLPYRDQQDEADAQWSLRVINPDRIETVNIAACVDGLMSALQPADNAARNDFVKGNIKARARMVAQYALANYNNGLVVGTDHAAEAVMGFFTKFGDGACDLAPLTGLVKGQVRQIATLLGAPEALVYKTPTADLEELEPGKPDEKAYGCTYEQIDDFLLGRAVAKEAEERIIQTYRRTEHKRSLPYTP